MWAIESADQATETVLASVGITRLAVVFLDTFSNAQVEFNTSVER
jgi:hypothetical protein